MFHEFYFGNGQLMSRILYWNIFTVPASIYRTISSSFVDSHVMQEGVPRPPKNGWYYSFPTHTLQVWFFFWWSLSTQNHHKKIKDVRVCFPQFQSKHPRFFFTRHHFTYCIIRQCNIYLSPYFQIKPTPRHVSFLSPLLNPNILPPKINKCASPFGSLNGRQGRKWTDNVYQNILLRRISGNIILLRRNFYLSKLEGRWIFYLMSNSC